MIITNYDAIRQGLRLATEDGPETIDHIVRSISEPEAEVRFVLADLLADGMDAIEHEDGTVLVVA